MTTSLVESSGAEPDYFKTLWSRYKKQTKVSKQGQTLYSLDTLSYRNIQAYRLITKLQKAMGHSLLK